MNFGDKRLIYRIWTYFRRGYTAYFTFLIGFLNFVVIQYSLLIQRYPILQEIFPNMYTFAAFAVIVIGGVTTLIGWWDYKRGSVQEETRLTALANPEWRWLKQKIERIEKELEEIKKR